MFFDEEEKYKNLENYGAFTPNNYYDYNASFYEVIYEKIYTR